MESMNKKGVVLVTAVGNIGTGSQIVECLFKGNNDNLYIIGTDISLDSIYCREKLDALYKVPRVTEANFEYEFERIILQHNVKIVFVGSINEAMWCYGHQDFFDRHKIFVVLGEEKLFNLCMRKDEMFHYLEMKNIPVPRYRKIQKLEDCEAIDFFPLVLKPNKYAIASNHVYVAFDKEELLLLSQYAIKNGFEMLAQEWKGDSTQEYSVSVTHDGLGVKYGSIAIKRDFSSSISRKISYRKKGQEYIISSGITQGVVTDNDHLLQQAEKIAIALNSKGPLNIQGIWENDIFWLIDAHPAITSGAYMRALSGYNEPLFWVELLLHKRIINLSFEEIRINRRMQVEVDTL